MYLTASALSGHSQSLERITNGLQSLGFENIRVTQSHSNVSVSVENNIYRWDPLAIAEALDVVTEDFSGDEEVHLILLEKGIPFCLIEVGSVFWKEFRRGNINHEEFNKNFIVTWEYDETWNTLKNIKPSNKNTGKADIVIYPQFSYENTRLAKIYETQLNIAPALEFSVWKGNKFTGQVIFPVHNELGYEGNFIRPGFVTLSQDFRLPKHFMGKFTTGNFGNSRYGFEIYLLRPFQNTNLNFEFTSGLTGFSHFFDSRWTRGNVNTFTWSSSLAWFYPKYNLVLRGGAARYIYQDYGLFASCSRYFGETNVGFYAQLNENKMNGGFIVTVPFPVKKRFNRKFIRINLPENYSLGYNAGAEFNYGQTFLTNADGFKIKFLNFTKLIKSEIYNL